MKVLDVTAIEKRFDGLVALDAARPGRVDMIWRPQISVEIPFAGRTTLTTLRP